MNELRTYIAQYTGMADDDLDIFLSFFHQSTLSKGDYFLRAGKVCDKFSFLASGLIRMYGHHNDKEVTQWIVYKGGIVADISGLVFEEPCGVNMQALNECELYTISKKDYNNMGNIIPHWLQIERHIISRCFSFIEKRLFSLLALSAEERYKFLYSLNPDLFTEVPLKYLASMMGITPESLSRIRKKMCLYGEEEIKN